MATLTDQLLADLGFSEESLDVFRQCGIQFYELVTYSVDDFESSLGQCDVNWNCPKIFEYVNAWRKRNKSTILQALRSDLIADKENQDPNNQETTDSQQLADDGIR
ncbi:uncharacterized protein LOC134287259 [Aedes albopictus]|uniref:Death domain-containing protein n=1 Tax=Aedes albopictus TaxID=7160 RepID=A0ABM1ZCU5_AEDAL